MILFEIINGYLGESYVRCYVWAHDLEEAKRLSKIPADEIEQIIRLFDSETPAFSSEISDCGFELEGQDG